MVGGGGGGGAVGGGLAGREGLVGGVVVEGTEVDAGGGVGGTVTLVPALFVRFSVPFDVTVNQLFAKPCPPACDWEWSPAKK